jgi:DeoR family suf operon transcriptional repressor
MGLTIKTKLVSFIDKSDYGAYNCRPPVTTMLLESASLEILPSAYRGPRGRILLDLKRNGFNTAKGLADALGLSLNAVRHHLKELETERLIEHRREQRGLGAPTFAFHLSLAGHELFPERCHEVAAQILERVSNQAGREAVTGALEERFNSLAARLDVDPAAGHAARLEAARRALQTDGFMAEWSLDTDGYRLTEHHCAFRSLAQRFPEICEIEARFLARVLSAGVERTSHMLNGCGACEYRVRFVDSLEATTAQSGGRGRELS